MSTDLTNHADRLNTIHEGTFVEHIGLTMTLATTERVEAELTLGPEHTQPYGLAHGGLYCTIVETLCSVGAAIVAMPNNQATVGLENSTSFLRGTRAGGRIRGVAKRLAGGRRTQVWECDILDDDDRVIASGRVRMLNIDKGGAVGGKTLETKTP